MPLLCGGCCASSALARWLFDKPRVKVRLLLMPFGRVVVGWSPGYAVTVSCQALLLAKWVVKLFCCRFGWCFSLFLLERCCPNACYQAVVLCSCWCSTCAALCWRALLVVASLIAWVVSCFSSAGVVACCGCGLAHLPSARKRALQTQSSCCVLLSHAVYFLAICTCRPRLL